MNKVDFTKKYKSYYTAKTKPEIVEIELAQFLSIEGKGDPSGEEFAEKVQALYTVAYGIKFIYKNAGNDFVVAKLEGLWWYDEDQYPDISMLDPTVQVPRSEWQYRLLIRMPDDLKQDMVQQAIDIAVEKKSISAARDISLHAMKEGKCVQALHVGPFATEPETLQRIIEFMTAHGLKRNGLHHEIYLSDFRKTAPEKLKTILREPCK